jgi:hypothetical protein
MSDPMAAMLREGERVSMHDVEAATTDADAMYDERTFTAVCTAKTRLTARSVRDDARRSGHGRCRQSVDYLALAVFAKAVDADANISTYGDTRASEARQSSIPIPPSLADIASQVKPLDLDFEDPALEIAYDLHREDRGEMGGKRKKPLNERAGWSEMDEKGNMPKKPRGRRNLRDTQADAFVGYQPGPTRPPADGRPGESSQNGADDLAAAAVALERDMAEAGRELGMSQGALADVLQQSAETAEGDMIMSEDDAQPGEGPSDDRSGAKPNK